jgi:hypothetical protein
MSNVETRPPSLEKIKGVVNRKMINTEMRPIYLCSPNLTGGVDGSDHKRWESLVYKLLMVTNNYPVLHRRKAPDGGIDIEYSSPEGEYYIFQCKFVDNYNRKINDSKLCSEIKELKKFMNTASNIPEHSVRYYLCTNVLLSKDQMDKINKAAGNFRVTYLTRDYWISLLLKPEAKEIRNYHLKNQLDFDSDALLWFHFFKTDTIHAVQIGKKQTVGELLKLLVSYYIPENEGTVTTLFHDGELVPNEIIIDQLNLQTNHPSRIVLCDESGKVDFYLRPGRKKVKYKKVAGLVGCNF